MVKLKYIIENNKDKWFLKNSGLIPVNTEDIFSFINNLGIDSVIVNKEEMQMLIRFFMGNSGNTELGSKVLSEGKLDKLYGVQLILE